MSIVILGGNECMERRYKDLCDSYQCQSKIFTKPSGGLRKKMGSPDLMIFFTSTMSHKMLHHANEQAKKKNISNATFVVGDCENFPFENDSFDAIICSMSFHHYPDPQAFFDSVKRCLRPNGRLILRDVTSDNKVLVWLMNTLEMPLANICGHGDVQVPTRDVVIKCCKKAGLKVEKFEIRKGMRMHCVVRKPMGKAIGNER